MIIIIPRHPIQSTPRTRRISFSPWGLGNRNSMNLRPHVCAEVRTGSLVDLDTGGTLGTQFDACVRTHALKHLTFNFLVDELYEVGKFFFPGQ